MSDYIDRQVALDALGVTKNATKYGGDHSGYDTRMLYEIQDTIESLEPADVVQVVRCVDCRRCSYDPLFNYFWCNLTLGTRRVKPDDFCSYGEKRGEE